MVYPILIHRDNAMFYLTNLNDKTIIKNRTSVRVNGGNNDEAVKRKNDPGTY